MIEAPKFTLHLACPGLSTARTFITSPTFESLATLMGFSIHHCSWVRYRVRRTFPCFHPRQRYIFPSLAVLCVMGFVAMSLLDMEGPIDLTSRSQIPEDNSVVTILLWSHPFGRYSKFGDCLERYQIRGCRITDDRRAYGEADAVIIHHRDIITGTALPQELRPAAQKWIWMNYESPTHSPGLELFEGIFNLTLTYRRGSDIFLPYGFLIPNTLRSIPYNSDQYLRTPAPHELIRPRLLAWVVSNWSESHARVVFYKQLQRFLRVDVYGRAGQAFFGDVVDLVRDYQFYLALENSQHTDYITEKLWSSIEAGAIPVVLGPSRENYERLLPPEAFIHVDDFATVRELAQYLLRLWHRPDLLMSHLSWRGGYRTHRPTFWTEHYCKACEVVRRTRGRTNVVKDLAHWFKS
ncbi:4-galactosyl-N-acetylglucosaminide 3-alpha-L-fucosyltransferase 9-like isoform X2 [Takifugu flavidus]|uniref:4-galactosyl-N-acetylglucosaminide 3-alpha-L-fucosyltransferase 9-like isoform X2 n=1 Tax=Takifugu flavidus TaxID=433684 RepID=UPI0025448A2C|nr:4-galactosyl-N-acetylglucosaminide 3-alpha-L-fucosyltransferase 9-like isoform X2 [Takifugu flavidus]